MDITLQSRVRCLVIPKWLICLLFCMKTQGIQGKYALFSRGNFVLELQNLFPASSQMIQVHLQQYLSICWKFCQQNSEMCPALFFYPDDHSKEGRVTTITFINLSHVVHMTHQPRTQGDRSSSGSKGEKAPLRKANPPLAPLHDYTKLSRRQSSVKKTQFPIPPPPCTTTPNFSGSRADVTNQPQLTDSCDYQRAPWAARVTGVHQAAKGKGSVKKNESPTPPALHDCTKLFRKQSWCHKTATINWLVWLLPNSTMSSQGIYPHTRNSTSLSILHIMTSQGVFPYWIQKDSRMLVLMLLKACTLLIYTK